MAPITTIAAHPASVSRCGVWADKCKFNEIWFENSACTVVVKKIENGQIRSFGYKGIRVAWEVDIKPP